MKPLNPDNQNSIPVIEKREVIAKCGECGRNVYRGDKDGCWKRACPVNELTIRRAEWPDIYGCAGRGARP